MTNDRELVAMYFARRPKFCTSMCPNYRELSDSCAVVDGEWEPNKCPDLANLKEKECA